MFALLYFAATLRGHKLHKGVQRPVHAAAIGGNVDIMRLLVETAGVDMAAAAGGAAEAELPFHVSSPMILGLH